MRLSARRLDRRVALPANGPVLGPVRVPPRARVADRPLRRWLPARRRDPGGRAVPALWIRVPVERPGVRDGIAGLLPPVQRLPRHIRSRAGEQRLLPLPEPSTAACEQPTLLEAPGVVRSVPRVPVEWKVLLLQPCGGQVPQEPTNCAANRCRDEETSHDLADENGHRSPTPFT